MSRQRILLVPVDLAGERLRLAGTRRYQERRSLNLRTVFASSLDAEAASTFARITIDGIREASLSVVVTYDEERGAPHVLGRHAIAEARLYSVCLAIENI